MRNLRVGIYGQPNRVLDFLAVFVLRRLFRMLSPIYIEEKQYRQMSCLATDRHVRAVRVVIISIP